MIQIETPKSHKQFLGNVDEFQKLPSHQETIQREIQPDLMIEEDRGDHLRKDCYHENRTAQPVGNHLVGGGIIRVPRILAIPEQ